LGGVKPTLFGIILDEGKITFLLAPRDPVRIFTP